MAQADKLSLYDELFAKGYEAAVIGSYNVNFPFFERLVLPRLQASGVRHVLLLMDASRCAAEFEAEEDAPRLCGSEYALLPVRTAAAFHPKFMLFLGRRGGRLLLGSHNLTVASFGLNREIGTAFEFRDDEPAYAGSVWRFIREWTSEFPQALQRLVGSCEQIAPWLKQAADAGDSPVVAAATRGPALWTRVRRRLPKRVTRAVAIAPFFDAELRLLKTVVDELRPKELIVGIDPAASEIRTDARRVLPKARFVDLSRLKGWEDQALHAKVYLFEGSDRSVVVTGSANASAPAWLNDGRTRNAEMVMVHEDGASLWKRLGLKDVDALPDVQREVWDRVRERLAARESMPQNGYAAPDVAITTEDGFIVDRDFIERASAQDVLVITLDAAHHVEDLRLEGQQATCVCSDPLIRDRAIRLEVRKGRRTVRFAIVHHIQTLLDKAAGNVRQAFRRALAEMEGDPEQLDHLLDLVQKVIFETDVQVLRPRALATAGADTKSDLERELGSLRISAADTLKARRARRLDPGSDLALVLDTLIYKLGLGLRQESGPAHAQPSEEEIAQSEEIAPAPQIDGAELARMCRGKVNRLFRRMEAQLELAVKRRRDVVPQIAQLAAVLSIVEYLRNNEANLDWLPEGDELVDPEHELDFFYHVSGYLYGTTSRLAALVREEEGEEFDELTNVRGLLTWLALDCGIDERKVLVSMTADPEEVRDDVEAVGYLVPVAVECSGDAAATSLLRRCAGDRHRKRPTAEDASFADRAEYHLGWARALDSSRAQAKPGPSVRVGDVVFPALMKQPQLSVVVQVQGDRASLLDLDTGDTKPFLSRTLAKVGTVGRGR